MIRAIDISGSLAVLVCVCPLVSPSDASNLSPGIHGTVFDDFNQDGLITPNEVLAGIPLQLYRDDGDGIFDPFNDTTVGSQIVSDAAGGYAFANLSGNDAFFVRQNATSQYQQSISPIIRPGDVDRYIDDFSEGTVITANNNSTIDTWSGIHRPSAPALDGVRRVEAELLSGAGDVRVLINPYGLDNRLIYSTSAGVTGRSRLTWDYGSAGGSGASVPNLSPIDLTDNGQLSGLMLRAGVDQSGGGDPMTMRLLGVRDSEFSEAIVSVPTTDGFDTDFIFVPFSDFAGPVDPNSVYGVEVIFGSGAPSVDASIEVVGLLGSKSRDFAVAANVPEPHSILMLISALVFLGTRRVVRGRSSR